MYNSQTVSWHISKYQSASPQQEHTFVTFDLLAAKLANNILWNFSEKYRNVFVHLKFPYYVCIQYMGALGTIMARNGFEDIVIQSSICASDSIIQIMNGKHNRAMRVHDGCYWQTNPEVFLEHSSTEVD